MIVSQFQRLLVNRLGDFGTAITNIDAVKTGKTVDELAAILVDDVNALAASDYPTRRLATGKVMQVAGGVEGHLAVAFDQITVLLAHSISLFSKLPATAERS